MPRFTPGELKVMRLLWEHGEMKPADLQGRFPEPIKNPALRSYLTTLVEKGHVTRRRVGKAYHYKPATRPRSAATRTDRLRAPAGSVRWTRGAAPNRAAA